MNDNDDLAQDCLPTANGILLCLRMLADEAISLDLKRTAQILRAAIMVAETEAADSETPPPHFLRTVASNGTRPH